MPTGVAARLELDEREASLLADVCAEALSELRSEIVRTESVEFRDALKQREELLRSLLARLPRVA